MIKNMSGNRFPEPQRRGRTPADEGFEAARADNKVARQEQREITEKVKSENIEENKPEIKIVKVTADELRCIADILDDPDRKYGRFLIDGVSGNDLLKGMENGIIAIMVDSKEMIRSKR